MRRLLDEMATIEKTNDADGLVQRIVDVMIEYHEANEGASARMTMLVEIGDIARVVSRWGLDARARARVILLPVRTTLEARLGRSSGPRINAEFVFAFWLPSWPTSKRAEGDSNGPPARKGSAKPGDSPDLRHCS